MTSEIFHELGRLPRRKAGHHWADYVELLTLANIDGEFSQADLLERWAERDDLGEDLPDLGAEVEEDGDGPIDPPQAQAGEARAARHERLHRLALDVFSHFAYRAGQFGGAYPFKLQAATGKLLERRVEPDNIQQNIYVFLLLASNLRYIRVGTRKHLTQNFERLTAEVLRRWLPNEAEIHIFGTTSGDDPTGASEGRYSGKLWAKLERLANDLGEQLLLSEEDFAKGDSGDLGLDTVAWLPMGDRESGLPVWFAQATCEAEWKHKQHESGGNWRAYLQESAPRGNLLFIPYCFRQPTGTWYDRKWPTAAVIIDRARLVWLLRDVAEPVEPVPYEVVKAALEFRLDPV